MNKEQKILLIIFFVLFFLIPTYGLSNSLSTYNSVTRLSKGLVFLLEIGLIVGSYIIFNMLSSKPFSNSKKHITTIFLIVLAVIGLIFLFSTYQKSTQPIISTIVPTVDDGFISPSVFNILNGVNNEGESVGKDSIGRDLYRFVIKNNGQTVARDIKIKFEYMKTKDGAVEDTKYVTLSQPIGPSDTVTQNVAVYTSFDTADQYWWRATILGATTAN